MTEVQKAKMAVVKQVIDIIEDATIAECGDFTHFTDPIIARIKGEVEI